MTEFNNSNPLLPSRDFRGSEDNIYVFSIYSMFPIRLIKNVSFEARPCVYILGNLKNKKDFDLLSINAVNIEEMEFNYIFIGETNNLSIEFENNPKVKCIDNFGATILFELYEKDENIRKDIVIDILKTTTFLCNS